MGYVGFGAQDPCPHNFKLLPASLGSSARANQTAVTRLSYRNGSQHSGASQRVG